MKIFDVIYQLETLQCLVTQQALESIALFLATD